MEQLVDFFAVELIGRRRTEAAAMMVPLLVLFAMLWLVWLVA